MNRLLDLTVARMDLSALLHVLRETTPNLSVKKDKFIVASPKPLCDTVSEIDTKPV